MADVSTLGIGVDTKEVTKASEQLDDLGRAADYAAKQADKLTTSADKQSKSVEKVLQGLEQEVAYLGRTANEITILKLASMGATEAQLKAAAAALNATEAYKQEQKAASESAKAAEERATAIVASADKIGRAIGASVVSAATAAVGYLALLDQLIKSVGEYQDIAEKTGGSAEGWASIKTAADVGNTSIEQLARSSVRLSASLSKVDDESKGVGKALGAIGLEVSKFKQLSPDEQIREVATALNKFEDGANKSAVAVALYGRAGAEMLPTLKELGSETQKQIYLTKDQIESADEYGDSQARTQSQLKQLAQATSLLALPAMTAFTGALKDTLEEMTGLSTSSTKLGDNTSVQDFANGAARVLGFVIDAGQGVARTFQVVGNAIGALAAATVAVASGNLSQAREIIRMNAEEEEKILQTEMFSAKLERRLAEAGKTKTAGTDAKAKEKLDYTAVTEKSERGVNKLSEALGKLEAELALFGADDETKTILNLKSLGASVKTLEEARQKLEQIKALRNADDVGKQIAALQETTNLYGLSAEEALRYKLTIKGATETQIEFAVALQRSNAALDEQAKAGQDIRVEMEKNIAPIEKYNKEIERLEALRKKGLSDTSYEQSAARAWNSYVDGIKVAQDKTEELDTFTQEAGRNIQDILGQGLEDLVTGSYTNIGKKFGDLLLKMASQAAAAQLGKALFGDLTGKTDDQGAFGGVLKAFGDILKGGAKGKTADPNIGPQMDNGSGGKYELDDAFADLAASAMNLNKGLDRTSSQGLSSFDNRLGTLNDQSLPRTADSFGGFTQSLGSTGSVLDVLVRAISWAASSIGSSASGTGGGGSGGWGSIISAAVSAWSGSGDAGSNYSNEGRNSPAPSAMGNVFQGGSITHAFKAGGILGPNGGILTQPTIFPMANGGTGIGGEAGHEAVVPLTRGPSGKLGLAAYGSGSGGGGSGAGATSGEKVIINIINQADGTTVSSTKKQTDKGLEVDVLVEQIEGKMAKNVKRGQGLAPTLEATYGLNRAAGASR